jgi:hypothetical protein
VDEPLTFEVGAGDMMGNRLFQVSCRSRRQRAEPAAAWRSSLSQHP